MAMEYGSIILAYLEETRNGFILSFVRSFYLSFHNTNILPQITLSNKVIVLTYTI